MILWLLLMAILVIDRGGVWYAAGAGVALYYVYRISSTHVRRLRTRHGNDSDPSVS